MSTVHVKDVPDETRDALAAAATRAGQSLQTYLLAVLEREARFARNLDVVERCPLSGADLGLQDAVAAVREVRGPIGP